MARRQDNKAWEDFVAWCAGRGLDAVPANPWTLAAYARWCEPHQTPRAIIKAVTEISRVHEDKTRKRIDRDPLIQRTLNMIESRHKEKKATPKPKVDLFDAPDNEETSQKTRARAKKKPSAGKPAKPDAKASRLKRGLSTTPRLVSKRRLKR